MMGAGSQFASLLVEEQLRLIREMYAQTGQPDYFRFVYLPMPRSLRESGSFGTHWMLQPNIKIDLGPHDTRNIKGEEMVELLRVLHGTGRNKKLSPDAQAVLDYTRDDNGWSRGARELGFIQK